jgi:hypothetical protein
MEDRVLQTRCEKIGLQVDRSQFYPIGDPNIIHLFDGVARIINSNDPIRATNDNGIDGIKTIHKLEYSIDARSHNELDNIYVVDSIRIFIINIETFMTGIRFENECYHHYDLREPPQKIMYPDNNKIHTNHSTDNWSHIPFYPTAQKKQELIHQYGSRQADEIIKYSYEHSVSPTQAVMPPHMINQIQQYNQAMRQMNSNHRFIPPNINKFSPAYARIIASKPKASSSVRIRLGGVY